MQFRILGPLESLRNGYPIHLAAPMQRCLLALLLINAGSVVSIDQIITHLWGPGERPRARKNLQFHVWKLRHALEPDMSSDCSVIATIGPGYRVVLDGHGLDAADFRRLVAQSRSMPVSPAKAEILKEALDLWRGDALADFVYEEFAQHAIMRLQAERLEAIEEHIAVELTLGHAQSMIGELEVLVSTHPTQERLCGQLMEALYRSGRQADALTTFAGLRGRLADRGLEPCPDLVDLESKILTHDPSLSQRLIS